MLTRDQAAEIIQALRRLPAEKVREVRDFALFLRHRSRPEPPVSESDDRTDGDIRRFLDCAEEQAPCEAPSDH